MVLRLDHQGFDRRGLGNRKYDEILVVRELQDPVDRKDTPVGVAQRGRSELAADWSLDYVRGRDKCVRSDRERGSDRPVRIVANLVRKQLERKRPLVSQRIGIGLADHDFKGGGPDLLLQGRGWRRATRCRKTAGGSCGQRDPGKPPKLQAASAMGCEPRCDRHHPRAPASRLRDASRAIPHRSRAELRLNVRRTWATPTSYDATVRGASHVRWRRSGCSLQVGQHCARDRALAT
jgi:hypothetical protein